MIKLDPNLFENTLHCDTIAEGREETHLLQTLQLALNDGIMGE